MDAQETVSSMLDATVGRRAAILGVGVAGLAALTGCASTSSPSSAGAGAGASGSGATSGSPSSPSASPSSSASSSSAAPPSPTGSGAGAASGVTLVDLAKVPVGEAVAAKGADGKPIVVAQPTAGTVVAFTAICTHMGCTVKPAGKELHCPCHGSVFDALTGAVKHGPAGSPLASVQVHVADGKVVSG